MTGVQREGTGPVTAARGWPGGGHPDRLLSWSLEMGVDRPPDGRVLIAAVVAAVVTDAVARSGLNGVGGAGLVAVVAAALVASGRLESGQAGAVAVASLSFAVWLPFRTSPWLLPLDVVAAGGLLVWGASLARGGSVLDLALPDLATRAVHGGAHVLAGPTFLARALPGAAATRARPSTALAVLRAVALVVAVVVPLGILLASADTVFASFFDGIEVGGLPEHGAALAAGAWAMAGLLRVASARPSTPLPRLGYRLGSLEATAVLGAVVVLFSGFATAQVVALTEGGRHVIETAGLTYAEYARSGFFQLVAVGALTLAVVLGLRAVTDLSEPPAERRFVVLAEFTVALTLVIVFVALRRLELYEDAFGMTMLRLYSQVFAVWIGVVLVLAALALAGVERRRHWLPPMAVVAGLVLLFTLNAVNPEAVVARHNLDRAQHTGRLDAGYLAELSADAVPSMVDALPRLETQHRGLLLAAICSGGDPLARGGLAYNHALQAAEAARRQACGPDLGHG